MDPGVCGRETARVGVGRGVCLEHTPAGESRKGAEIRVSDPGIQEDGVARPGDGWRMNQQSYCHRVLDVRLAR